MEYKKISEELINDVAHYQQHNDCDSSVCFTYDPSISFKIEMEFIRDIQKLSTPEFSLRVFISK
jgi:hypothetical protein